MSQSSSTPPSGPVALLPVGQTVADAYRFTLQHLGQVLTAAVVPFVISMAITTLSAMAANPALGIVLSLAEVFAYAIFAVAWHRALLVGERPPLIPQLGGRQLRFWVMTLAVGAVAAILVGVPAGLAAGGMGQMGAGNMAPALLVLPMLLLAGYLVARFSFVFPAAAVDENFGLGDSWRTTAGNAWRLIGAYILALLPMLAAAFVLMLIGGTLLGVGGMMGGAGTSGGGEVGGIGAMLFLALAAVMNYIFAAVFVSLLSLAFRTCTGWVPDLPGGGGPPSPQGSHGPHASEWDTRDRDGGGDAGFEDSDRR